MIPVICGFQFPWTTYRPTDLTSPASACPPTFVNHPGHHCWPPDERFKTEDGKAHVGDERWG